ncbi:hypothetical protein NDU88_008672 [Pleurodeles waltl]|uniref:Uncharacterized protein n=1 Tax=Pleurodeles waltl TaxID=8319 RepID=A0AAV7N5M4_PLEWA|nr:hypothetical protein NDU88_008672 [Pleurodeles waltl]
MNRSDPPRVGVACLREGVAAREWAWPPSLKAFPHADGWFELRCGRGLVVEQPLMNGSDPWARPVCVTVSRTRIGRSRCVGVAWRSVGVSRSRMCGSRLGWAWPEAMGRGRALRGCLPLQGGRARQCGRGPRPRGVVCPCVGVARVRGAPAQPQSAL